MSVADQKPGKSASHGDSLSGGEQRLPPQVQAMVDKLHREGRNPTVRSSTESQTDSKEYMMDKEEADAFVAREKA